MMRQIGLVVAAALTSMSAAPAEAPLADAFRAGDLRSALASLAAGADVNTPDSRGYTPMMWAASWGSVEGTEALLQKGAKVNVATSSRRTAIVFAIENGHTEVAKRLLAAGANLVIPDPAWSARQAAKTEAMVEVAQRAIELGDLLMAAVSARDSRRVSELTAKGAPLGYTRSNAAALQVAAAQGDIESIRILLAAGASLSDDYTNPVSPLEWAVARDQAAAVRVLLAQQSPDAVVRKAVQLAASRRNPSVLAAFQRQGRDRLPGAADRSRTAARISADAVFSRLSGAANWLPSSEQKDRILDNVKWLMNRSSDGWAATSEEYKQSLARSAELLESAVSGRVSGAEASRITRDVADDLEDKVAHCRALGVGMGGTVRLRVRTRRADREVGNWQVFYVLKIFENAPEVAPGLFPRWSSPTEEALEPGRYWLWARDPVSKRTGERTLVRLSGKTEETVDLALP